MGSLPIKNTFPSVTAMTALGGLGATSPFKKISALTALEGLVDSLPIQHPPPITALAALTSHGGLQSFLFIKSIPLLMTAWTVLGGPIGTYPIQSIPRPLQF